MARLETVKLLAQETAGKQRSHGLFRVTNIIIIKHRVERSNSVLDCLSGLTVEGQVDGGGPPNGGGGPGGGRPPRNE